MKTKKGAASFYIVAFSTLVLVVVATSFTLAILSNLTRTANDDLAQSAYDSALAGIEDAKLAYYEYQKCLNGSQSMTSNNIRCDNVKKWVEEGKCNMVAKILGRISEESEENVVFISESITNNNDMEQAYTCVKFSSKHEFREGSLIGGQSKVIRVRDDLLDKASDVTAILVKWSPSGGDDSSDFIKSGKVSFPSFNDSLESSMLAVGLVQTANSFSLSQFDESVGDKTNRGMVFLVPTTNSSVAAIANSDVDNHKGVYDGSKNVVSASDIVKSNDHAVKNVPFVVYCNDGECQAELRLPKPVDGGERNTDTFLLVLSLPYGSVGEVGAKYAIKYCFVDDGCDGEWKDGQFESNETTAEVEGQVEIDSTGRANDLYRRVKARLEPTSNISYSSYAFYALELLGTDDGSLIEKPYKVTSEYNDL